MSLGYFFANSKPIQQDLLAGIVRPEKVWLRDLMLLDQKNIILLTSENRLAQCLIQSACNDLRALSQQDVFHFDFHRFLALVQSPLEANRLFEEFLDDLSHTKSNTWIYVQNLDELLLHDDPVAKTLIQHLMRANYVSQCRLILTLRATENLTLLETQYAVFYHHTEILELSPVTLDEQHILLRNAVRRLERQYLFKLEQEAPSHLLAILSRYVAPDVLLVKALEMIKMAVARLNVTRARQAPAQLLSLQAVLQVLSDWAQIPLQHLIQDTTGEHTLGDFLQQQIMGQEAAIAAIADAVASPPWPLLVFYGPRSCGKTATAAAIARYYNGAERYLVSIDLNQYPEDARWEDFIVPSPDYQAKLQPLLTVIKQTPGVILGFKLAKSRLGELSARLSPVLQQGGYLSSSGELINFSQVKCIVLVTADPEGSAQSSVPASSVKDDLLRLVCEPEDEETLVEAAVVTGAPSLVLPSDLQAIARLICFTSVTDVTIKAIIQQELRGYCSKMHQDHQVMVTFQDEVVDYLLQQVLHSEQGIKAIDGVFQAYLHPAVERSVVCVDQTSGQQMLVLMLNDTGQLLMGQLMPYSQGQSLQI